jgi:broad specificity phosphatase PhoE
MTRLIIIRHGQSLANAENLFAGLSDYDLSPLGHKQAALAAEYLAQSQEHIDVIYASDLKRAYHTATPIGERLSLPVIKDTGLREIFGGAWESMCFSDIADGYPEEFAVWREDYSHARPVDGEATAEVYERVVPHICALAQKHDGKTVLLATHATVTRAFDAFARGYSKDETGKISFPHNASINIYEYENGRANAVRTNITEHLGDLVTSLPPIINA